MERVVKRIVLIGGHCSGKTTAIGIIREKYEKEEKILKCYENIKNHEVVDNSTDFIDKVINLINDVLNN